MKRAQFPLTSDQLELLLAFEQAGSLEALAQRMCKDPSVISRRLQTLAQTAAVLNKAGGRWRLTHLGRKINQISLPFLLSIQELVSARTDITSLVPSGSALMILNAQNGLHDGAHDQRNNMQAESHILRLLKLWRRLGWPIVHVKHVSLNSKSRFKKGSRGAEFIPALAPQRDETVFVKSKSSAFSNPKLRRAMRGTPGLVLVGFTAGDCIEATARQAKDLDFEIYVVGDATATFDVQSREGELIPAARVHRAVLTHIHAFVGQVLDSATLLGAR